MLLPRASTVGIFGVNVGGGGGGIFLGGGGGISLSADEVTNFFGAGMFDIFLTSKPDFSLGFSIFVPCSVF